MNRNESRKRTRNYSGSRRADRGGTLLGIFIGLVLGLALAAGVAYFIGRTGLTASIPAPGATKETPRSGKTDGIVTGTASDKPRFDFYKILPGTDETKGNAKGYDKPVERPGDKAPRDSAAKASETTAAVPGERFYLQAGAFAALAEAEDLKARLALSGWEAAVQTAALPDKSVRYRVRLGPYDNTDELNKTKAELGKRGFDVAVIKNP
jgi:SPOR domain